MLSYSFGNVVYMFTVDACVVVGTLTLHQYVLPNALHETF